MCVYNIYVIFEKYCQENREKDKGNTYVDN